MGMFLIVAVCVWVGLSTVFVLALMCAASRRVPSLDSERTHSPKVAADSRLTSMLAEDEKETHPVLDT